MGQTEERLSNLRVTGAAHDFIEQSDDQKSMWDIYVRYHGEVPQEKAFKILDIGTTKIVNSDGTIVPIRTSDFVGGVMYGLLEEGFVDSDEWPPNRVLELATHIGSLLGKRQMHRDMTESAARSALSSSIGNVIPTSWLEDQLRREDI